MLNKYRVKFFKVACLTFIFLTIFIISAIYYHRYKTEAISDKFLYDQIEAEKQALKKKEEQIIENKRLEEEKLKKEKDEKIQQAILGKGISKSIPILMYHSIEYEKGNGLRIPKEKFKSQMQHLKDKKFTPISLEELYDALVFQNPLPEKPIVITFDDGYVDNYINAYPVLKEFGFKATVFMVSGLLDNPFYLNEDQLKELDENNIAIESHSVNHQRLAELSYEDQKNELLNSKLALEGILNREVKYFAYPYGSFNETTEKLLQEIGYRLGVTTVEGKANISNGVYKLDRIYISNNHSIEYYEKVINE